MDQIQLPPQPQENREMVPGLHIQVLINRTDKVGMQVAAEFKMMNPDKAPFDRVTAELRAQLHGDLDRLMNDVNKIWNKSFRDQEQILKEMAAGNPLMAFLMQLQGGMAVGNTELGKALSEHGRFIGGGGSSDSEKAPTAPPTPGECQIDPASENEPSE